MTKCFKKLKINIVDPKIHIFERNYVLMIICGLQIEDWENPNFTTYVNFKLIKLISSQKKLIKLINRLSPIVNVILETFLRFKCTPIEIAQESFKETFLRLYYKNNARNTNFFT